MEFYESRRARRLRIERERHAKAQTLLRRVGVLGAAVVLMLLVGVLWRAVNASVEQAKIKQQQLAAQQKIESSPTYVINRDLPGEISKIDQSLNLPINVANDDLPTSSTVAVALIDLSSKNRGTVDYNGGTQFTSASTYKLFVAYEEVHAIETGRLTWNSPLNGTTLDQCFTNMIHVSDNDCPQDWIVKYSSFTKLTTSAQSLGMSSATDFTYGNMRTSADDLAKFLQELYQGKLMNSTDQQKLLTLMENQIYRAGIPAGIAANSADAGAYVADKVGFLDTLKNDAAIVYSPHGDYVLVIMTNGDTTVSGSTDWRFTAALAEWIDQQMSQ